MRRGELFVFFVLMGLVWMLVFVDCVRSGTSYQSSAKDERSGLMCVYNCESFDEVVPSVTLHR